MKKIEHTYNFNFKNKYRLNQPMSECKYTYCCDSFDNAPGLCEETSFYSSETPNMRKRRLRRKKLVKKVKRNGERKRCYSSSDSDDECDKNRRSKYQRVFIHQKIIYDEYVTKKNKKFYPMRLKMLSQEKWNLCGEEATKKKDVEEKEEEKVKKEEAKDDGKEKDVSAVNVGEQVKAPPCPPLPFALPPLPPPPPPPLPPPPPPPLPPAVRIVAVNNGAYLPVQQVAAARPATYNERLPYGGIAYEIPVDVTYIIGCNAMFRQF